MAAIRSEERGRDAEEEGEREGWYLGIYRPWNPTPSSHCERVPQKFSPIADVNYNPAQ